MGCHSEMLDEPFQCVNMFLGSQPLCGLCAFAKGAPGNDTPSASPLHVSSQAISSNNLTEWQPADEKKCCWSKDTNKKKLTKHLMLKYDSCHIDICKAAWEMKTRVGRWGGTVWFKLLRRARHRYLNIPLLQGQTDCAFKASLGVLVGKLKPSVPVSLLPYYLTLIKHYMAQQKGSQSQQLPPWVSISAVTWESFF